MKSVKVSGPGTSEVIEIERPKARPSDVLVKIKACGLSGSDDYFTKVGEIPPRAGAPSLGCGPAGEVVDVGAQVRDVAASDHVVINPMAAPAGIIGSGGTLGALSEELVLKSAQAGIRLPHHPEGNPRGGRGPE